jgi:hypothetical protein
MTDHRIDLPATALMLNAVFDPSPPLTVDELDWYYYRNPAGAASVGEAVDESRKVGNYALVPIVFDHPDGRTVRLGLGVDLSVHPDARGTGAYRRTVEHSYATGIADGLDGILGVANAQSAPRMAETMRWRRMDPLPVKLLWPCGRPLACRDLDVTEEVSDRELSDLLADPPPPGPNFTPRWTGEVLAWRLRKARATYRLHIADEALIVSTRTTMAGVPFAVVLKTLPRRPGVRLSSTSVAARVALSHRTPLVVHWGTSQLMKPLGMPLPRERMPSPLELVLHELNGDFDEPGFELSGFEFLDFDGY